MHKLRSLTDAVKPWFAKAWLQWLLAGLFFFFMSWFFMGSAITHCTNNTMALGSDSTGGFAWMQWAGGNDFSWGHTNQTNYPTGETLTSPIYITSAVFIFLYKMFASLTTPICGLNLMALLGYMSTGLLMFGFIRWLLSRTEIALFAGFAAAFVPFHTVKAQSHINYMYGSTFIATIWAFLWLMSRPSYRRAFLLSLVGAIGFYFDGYFILFTAVLLGSLYVAPFLVDIIYLLKAKTAGARRKIIWGALTRAKYLIAAGLFLIVLLLPILVTYEKNSGQISQTLATGRSSVRGETQLYGSRLIEFVVPSYNSALMPDGYVNWRATKLHGSNFSESTLYVGYTILLLATAAIGGLLYKKTRALKFQDIPYANLVCIVSISGLACLLLSVPAVIFIFGHDIRTPVYALTKVTSNWRTLSRFFLVIDPLIIALACLGLYVITKNLVIKWRLVIVTAFSILLFLEYLPAPLHATGNLYRDAPAVYKQVHNNPGVKLVAEYPLASFVYTPEIFTFQPVLGKVLLNANNANISRGPFDASIAGLNDVQTLGVLKKFNVDVIITHGFASDNPGLTTYYPKSIPLQSQARRPSSIYSYTINGMVTPRNATLEIKKGYESLFVDDQQISHRFVTNQATLGVANVSRSPLADSYTVSFEASSICPVDAHVTITQYGKILWSGSISKRPTPINLNINNQDFMLKTTDCAIGITNMSAEARQ